MVSFVLCSGLQGGGDAASAIMNWFSGKVGKSDVASISGKPVTERQLITLRMQREMANTYMSQATEYAAMMMRSAKQKELEGKMGTAAKDDPARFQRVLTDQLKGDADYAALSKRFQDPLITPPQNMPIYFPVASTAGPFASEGLLDFLVWKQEADRLGIHLTDKDVNTQIFNLLRGKFDKPIANQVEANIRNNQRFRQFYTPEFLIDALREEFRVQLAQAALIGYDPGTIFQVAAPFTPDEFWNFYKDYRTTVEVGLVPVKVEDFVAKVTDKPTDQQIKELYNKYKDALSSPDSATPGFKQPQRVQIEWLSAKVNQPIFAKIAKHRAAAQRVAQRVGLAFGNVASLTGPTVLGTQVSLPGAFDQDLYREYERAKEDWMTATRLQLPSWTNRASFSLHDSSWGRPADVASTVGLTFGAPAGALSALWNLEALANRQETAERARIGATRILSGAIAGPVSLLPTLLQAQAMATVLTPAETHYPLSEVKTWLFPEREGKRTIYLTLPERIARDQVRRTRNEVLSDIQKEIAALGKSRDKVMLEKYLASVIAYYGLQTGTSAPISEKYETRFTLKDDPGLKPLKDEYLKPPSEDAQAENFDNFFLSLPVLSSAQKEDRPVSRFPNTPSIWESGDEAYLYWKTADKPARIVPLDDPKLGKEVRAEVEKAWRWQKARELAKKEAERIAKLAQATKGDDRKLEDLSLKESKKPLIKLLPLAYRTRRGFQPGDYQYDEARVFEDQVPHSGDGTSRKDIEERKDQRKSFIDLIMKFPEFASDPRIASGLRPIPPNRFGDQVVSLRSKQKGDTVLVPDQPEAAFYVAVLIDKTDPSKKEFYDAYRDAAANAAHRDPLLRDFDVDRQKKYLRDAIEQLRKTAKLQINEENFKRLRDSGTSEE
jgi:hypothetical protein